MNTETRGDSARLAELIKDIRVAMFTTFPGDGPKGGTHTRPMYTQTVDPKNFDGDLWFMTHKASVKIQELAGNPSVMVTYCDPGKEQYVVIQGEGRSEVNPAKAQELWNIHAKGWWPGGPDDPELKLICVTVHSAEYWDGPSQATYMLSLLKAVATGEKIQLKGEHGKVGADPARAGR